jgi:hypothetical protein
MSKNKGPFDAVIDTLTFSLIGGDLRKHTEKMIAWPNAKREKQAREAIHVLKDWPKWKPLIEAAGKVDKEGGLKFIHACGYPIFPYPKNARQIRALLKSLPDGGEK